MSSTRLTPLGRLVLLVALLSSGAVAGAAGAAAVRPHADAWRCVSVRPGDTLWGLARRSSTDDPREVVDRIVEENDLRGGAIHPGMGLWIPVPEGAKPPPEPAGGAVCR